MYFALVALLLLILPVASIVTENSLSPQTAGAVLLTGKWFVFWSIGVRLFLAGVRQILQPRFTAEEIFAVRDPGSFAIVREVGFANLSMGVLGICSIVRIGWIVPAAVVGGLYYGLAGIGHLVRSEKNAKEYFALVSDFFIFLVLLGFVVKSHL
jgi:hypothetical protein